MSGVWVCRIQSPNKSIRQWRKAGQAEATPPSLVNPIDAEDAMGANQSGQPVLNLSNLTQHHCSYILERFISL